MAKRSSASSARAAHRAPKEKSTGGERIDFSDIPELTATQLKRAKKLGRPKSANPKQLIAIRIAPKLLHALKALAKKRKQPYQALMHELLEHGVKRAA
jgi:predicted DNA binding CopG/RHH family protein